MLTRRVIIAQYPNRNSLACCQYRLIDPQSLLSIHQGSELPLVYPTCTLPTLTLATLGSFKRLIRLPPQ
jgi:hypothetical protein